MAKSKGKKNSAQTSQTSSSPPPVAAEDEEALVDALLAQLDSKDPAGQDAPPADTNERQPSKDDTKPKQASKSRHKARQARKAVALAEQSAPVDAESDARLAKEAADEEQVIKNTCERLGAQIHDITPDGHCLFSAIADQLHLLGILPPTTAHYSTVRRAAADYIFSHPDDFIPFLPTSSAEDDAGGLMTSSEFEAYCATIRNTGAWGGEPEIVALSRAYQIPVYVIQGTSPPIVEHNPHGNVPDQHSPVVRISYHRRLYGLGEHYNSLRPKVTHP